MLETGRESQTDPAAECGRTLQGSILLCPYYSPEGKERQYTIGHDRRCRCLRHMLDNYSFGIQTRIWPMPRLPHAKYGIARIGIFFTEGFTDE